MERSKLKLVLFNSQFELVYVTGILRSLGRIEQDGAGLWHDFKCIALPMTPSLKQISTFQSLRPQGVLKEKTSRAFWSKTPDIIMSKIEIKI